MNELFNDLFVPAVAVSGILALANIAMFVTIVAKNRGFTILALERLLSFLILIAGATVSFVTRNAVFSVIAPACSCLFVFFDIAVKPGRKEEEKKEEEVAPDTGVSEYEQQISRIFDLLKDLMTRVQECFTLTDGINVVKFLDLFISTVSNEIEADGGVVFLIDDYENLAVLPIEVKSGRDYMIHSAINKFLSNPDYPVMRGVVLSNDREIKTVGKITYYPIYFIMFFKNSVDYGKDLLL